MDLNPSLEFGSSICQILANEPKKQENMTIKLLLVNPVLIAGSCFAGTGTLFDESLTLSKLLYFASQELFNDARPE